MDANFRRLPPRKPVRFMGSSLDSIKAFPKESKQEAGDQLLLVQIGNMPEDWKAMPDVGAGVFEIRIHKPNEYRVLYVASSPKLSMSSMPLKRKPPKHRKNSLKKQGRHMPKSKDKDNHEQATPWVESCGNIYKDLGFSDEEAASLLVRASLLLQLQQIIKDKNWTQEEAAKSLKVKQPRIAEIMSLKTQCFSVDLLLKYLSRLGKRVELTILDTSQVA